MPTARPRHTITETDEIEEAIELAARHWPTERHKRSRLLLRLVREGRRSLQVRDVAAADRQREAIRRTSGTLSACYPEGYLDELRRDWPA